MQSLSSLSSDSQSTSSSSTNSSDRGRRIRKDALLKKWSKIKPFRRDSETLHIADILRKLEKLKDAVENVRMDLAPDSGQPSCIQCRAETPSDFSLLSDIMSGNLLERASEIEQKLMDISSGFMNKNGKEDMQAVEKLEREIRRIYPGCEKTVHVARRIDCNQVMHGEREACTQEQKLVLDIETQKQDEQPENIQFIVNKTADQNIYNRKKKNQFRQVVTTTEKIMKTDQQYVHMYDTILEDDGRGPFDRKILTQRSKTRFETIQGMDPTKEVLERRRITRFINNRTKEVVELISDLGNRSENSKEPSRYGNAPPISNSNSLTGGSKMSLSSSATWPFRQPLEEEVPKGDFKSRWNLVKSRAYMQKSDDSIFTESLLSDSSSTDNQSGQARIGKYRSGISMNHMKSLPQLASGDKSVDVVYRKRSFDNEEYSDAFSREQSFWVNTISYLDNEVSQVKHTTDNESASAFREPYESDRKFSLTNKEPSFQSLFSFPAPSSKHSRDLAESGQKEDYTTTSKHGINQPPEKRPTYGQNISSKMNSKYDANRNMDGSIVFSGNKGDLYSLRSQETSVRQSYDPSVYIVGLPGSSDNKFIGDLENLSSNLPPLRHAERSIVSNNMPYQTSALTHPYKEDDISILNNNRVYVIKEPMSRLQHPSDFESTWTRISTTQAEGEISDLNCDKHPFNSQYQQTSHHKSQASTHSEKEVVSPSQFYTLPEDNAEISHGQIADEVRSKLKREYPPDDESIDHLPSTSIEEKKFQITEEVGPKKGTQNDLDEVIFLPSFIISANPIPDKPLSFKKQKRRRKSKNKPNYVETSSNESNRSENEEFVGQMFLTSRPFCAPTPENLSCRTKNYLQDKNERFDSLTKPKISNISDSGTYDPQPAVVTKVYVSHDDFKDDFITERSMQPTLYQNGPSSHATSSIYQKHLNIPVDETDTGQKSVHREFLKVSQHSGGSKAATMDFSKMGFVKSSEDSTIAQHPLYHQSQPSRNYSEQLISKYKHSNKNDNRRQPSAGSYHSSLIQTVPNSKQERQTENLSKKSEDEIKITRINLGSGEIFTENISPQNLRQPDTMSARSHAGQVSAEYHGTESQLPIVFVVEPSTKNVSALTVQPVELINSFQTSQHPQLTQSNLSYLTSKVLDSKSTYCPTAEHVSPKTWSNDFQNEHQAMGPSFYSSIFASEPSETFQSRTCDTSAVKNEKTVDMPADFDHTNSFYNKNASLQEQTFTHDYAGKSNPDDNQIDHPSALWHSNINQPKDVKSNLPQTSSMIQRPEIRSRSIRIIPSPQPSEHSRRSVTSKLTRDNASGASLLSIQHHPSMRSIPVSRQSAVQKSFVNSLMAPRRTSGYSVDVLEGPERKMPQPTNSMRQHSSQSGSPDPSTALTNTAAALKITENASRASLNNMQYHRLSMRSMPGSQQSAAQQSMGIQNTQSRQSAAPERPSGYSIKVSESRGSDRSMPTPTYSTLQHLHRSVSQIDIPTSPEPSTALTNIVAASQTSFRNFEKPRIFSTPSATNLKEISTKEDIIQSLLTTDGEKSDESLIDHSGSEILSILYLDRDEPAEVKVASIVNTEESRGKAGESAMRLSNQTEQINQVDDLPPEHASHSQSHTPMRKQKPALKTRLEIPFPTDPTGMTTNPDEVKETGKKLSLGDRGVSFAHFPEIRSYVVDSDKPLRKFRSKSNVTPKQDSSSNMTISSSQTSLTSMQQATGNTAGITDQKEMPGRQRSGESVQPEKPECLSNKLAPYFEVLLQDDEAKLEESRLRCLENLDKKKQNDKVQPIVPATTSKPAVVPQQSRASTSKPPPVKPVSISNYNLDDLFQSERIKIDERKTVVINEKSKVAAPEIVVVKPPSDDNVSNVSKKTQEPRSVIAANVKSDRSVQREERAPSLSNLQLNALFADTSRNVSERNVPNKKSNKDVSVQNQQSLQTKSSLHPEEANQTSRQSEIQAFTNNATLLAQQQQQAAQSFIQTQRPTKEHTSQISTKQSAKSFPEIKEPTPIVLISPESLRSSQSGSTLSEEGSEQQEQVSGPANDPTPSHLGTADENSIPTRQQSTLLEKVLSLINPLTSASATPKVPSQSNLHKASNISMKVPANIETSKSQNPSQLAGPPTNISAMNKDNQSKLKLTSIMALNDTATVLEVIKSQTQSTQQSPSIVATPRDDNFNKLKSNSKLLPVGTSKVVLPNETIPPVQGGASIAQVTPRPEPPTQVDNIEAKTVIEQDDKNKENPAEPRLESGQQPEKQTTTRPNLAGKSHAARKREIRRTIAKRPEPPKSFFASKFLSRFLSRPMTSEEELYRERRYLQIAVVDDPEEIPEGDSSMLERFRCYSVRSRTLHLTDSEIDVLCTKKAERVRKEAHQLRRGRSRADFTLEYMSR